MSPSLRNFSSSFFSFQHHSPPACIMQAVSSLDYKYTQKCFSTCTIVHGAAIFRSSRSTREANGKHRCRHRCHRHRSIQTRKARPYVLLYVYWRSRGSHIYYYLSIRGSNMPCTWGKEEGREEGANVDEKLKLQAQHIDVHRPKEMIANRAWIRLSENVCFEVSPTFWIV